MAKLNSSASKGREEIALAIKKIGVASFASSASFTCNFIITIIIAAIIIA